jgi:hypoxanthine-guanine phosphoribosyltransferase
MVNNPHRNIRVHGTQYLLESLSADDSLLIVDDVCGSGWTLSTVVSRLKSRLRRNMPSQVRTAVVWNKPELNRSGVPPDYAVYETEKWLVLPYELDGLTEGEIAAHKPYVAGLLA